jgi:hypothetical protein
LLRHPLAEVRGVGGGWLGLLREAYPTTFSRLRTGVSGVGVGEGAEARAAWSERVARRTYDDGSEPLFVEVGEGSLEDVEFHSTVRPRDLAHHVDLLSSRPRGAVLPHWLSDLGQASFSFLLDFGSFRDLQRHRNGVCRMPLLTTEYGFEPWYLDPRQLGGELAREAERLVLEQSAAVGAVDAPAEEKQYLTAMGYRVPVRVTYGLPAAVYVLELRSGRGIHPTLRAAVKRMAGHFRRGHPEVALHTDEEPSDWDVRRGRATIQFLDASRGAR